MNGSGHVHKACKKCGVVKPLTDFYRASGTRDGRRGDCIECNLTAKRERNARDPGPNRDRVRRWRRENPDKLAAWAVGYRQRPDRKRAMRDLYYRRTHGISADEVDSMIHAQGGRCAICGNQPRRLAQMHVDHDHSTDHIRGVLCSTCNKALGQFEDDLDRLLRAVVYLRNDGVVDLLRAS